VELRQASIAAGNPGNALKHGVSVHFELPVGKGIAGQRVQREKGAKHLAIGVGLAVSEQPKLFPRGFRSDDDAHTMRGSTLWVLLQQGIYRGYFSKDQ
jgi:hypothetical protein